MNTLMHKTEVVERETVETVGQLCDALHAMLGRDDRNLADTYVVELVAETLSDGSEALSVRLRLAERLP